MSTACLCLLAKPPLAGHSKTRLAAGLGELRALELATAFLVDTWDALGSLPGVDRAIATTGGGELPFAAAPWTQADGDLGARMEHTLRQGLAHHDVAIAVGADSPGLPRHLYLDAVAALEDADAVLGPALDGGFYLIGLRACPPGLLADLPWSSPHTFTATRDRLAQRGLRVALLPEWWDVDEPQDLLRLTQHLRTSPALAPATSRALGLTPASSESAMPRLSQRVLSLQESAIRKLDAVVRAQRGVSFHRLNIGQPDIATPEPLLDVIQSWRPKVIAYGPASGTPSCRDAAAAYHSAWAPSLTGEHVAVTAGGSEALLFAFCAICDPGDDVLVPEPYYTNYNGFATVAGCLVRPVPTRLEDGFALPSNDQLDALVGPRTRALVFANPGNPTGVVYPRAELERVVNWAASRDLFIIADEVYRRIWFDEPPTSALEFDSVAQHVVVVDSMSKTYSACGLRVGFFISRNLQLMEKIERLGQARLGVQPLSQDVAVAALQLPASYYEELRLTWKGRVHAMMGELAKLPNVTAATPHGAFYTMVGLPVDDTEAFARFLVTDFRHEGESLVVAPGGGFYSNPALGRNQVRLAAVADPAHLQRAITLLGLGLEAWAAGPPSA